MASRLEQAMDGDRDFEEAFNALIVNPPETKDAAEVIGEQKEEEVEEKAEEKVEEKAEEKPEEAEKATEETAEEKTEEKPAERAGEPKPAPVVPEKLKARFGEKTLDEIAQEVDGIATELDSLRDSNDQINTLLDKHPAMIDILRDLKKDIPLHEAVRKHLQIEETVPDPAEDPKAYDAYVRKQVELESKKRTEQQQAEKQRKMAEEAQSYALSLRDDFKKTNNISDAEFDKFANWVKVLIYGDPITRKLPSDFFPRMYKAYRYEEDMQKAKKEGEVEGAVKAVEKVIAKKTAGGDGTPAFKGGKPRLVKVVDELSDLEASVRSSSRLGI